MEYKVISSSSPSKLTREVNAYLDEGWKVIGSHTAVVVHTQYKYAGTQLHHTQHEVEYSQTIINETRRFKELKLEDLKNNHGKVH